MFIDKEKWNKLIESFNKVYSNYDYFSDNMKDLIDKVDICIDDIKRNRNKYICRRKSDSNRYSIKTNKKTTKRE